MADQLLTARQTCEQLHIARATLHRWVQAGRIAPIRLSARATRYRQTDIDQLIATHTHDDNVIWRHAHAYLAERHAEEERPLCPACGRRRINRGQSMCTWCDQAREAKLLAKRRWWDAHGAANRAQRRQEAAS